MKYFLVAAIIAIPYLAMAQIQTADIDLAMKHCEDHRIDHRENYRGSPLIYNAKQKFWIDGWENCSTVKDLYDAAHDKKKEDEEAAKALVNKFKKK